MKSAGVVLFVFGISLAASAQVNGFHFQQYVVSKEIVFITQDQEVSFPAGQVFSASWPDGTVCDIELESQQGKNLSFDTQKCAARAGLLSMASFAPSEGVVAKKPEEDGAKKDLNLEEDSIERSNRNFIFTPEAGHFKLDLNFTGQDEKTDVASKTGTKVGSEEVNAGTSTLSAEVGLTDRLFADASISYSGQVDTDSVTGNSDEIYNHRGMELPSLGLGYRLLKQDDSHPFDLILEVDTTLKIFKTKDASSGTDGTSAAVASTTTLSLGLYHIDSLYEVFVAASVKPKASGTSEEVGTSEKSHDDIPSLAQVIAGMQLAAGRSCYFFGEAEFGTVGASTSYDSTSTTNTDSYNFAALELGIKFILDQAGSSYLSLAVTGASYGKTKAYYNTTNTTEVDYDNHTMSNFTVAVGTSF